MRPPWQKVGGSGLICGQLPWFAVTQTSVSIAHSRSSVDGMYDVTVSTELHVGSASHVYVLVCLLERVEVGAVAGFLNATTAYGNVMARVTIQPAPGRSTLVTTVIVLPDADKRTLVTDAA